MMMMKKKVKDTDTIDKQRDTKNDAASFVILTEEEVCEKLGITRDGVREEEAAARREKWGRNEIPGQERNTTLSRLVARQFKSALVLILIAAAGVSFTLRDHVDAYVILLAVAINVSVGAYQERKASNALAALKQVVVTMARVKRDGEVRLVRQEELVPGDVIVVQSGDRVPADARVLGAQALEANEATLTGESHPQGKRPGALREIPVLAERANMIFLGTTITAGKGIAVVVATGARTEMGRIAGLLKSTQDERTPLQDQLTRFAKIILWMVAGIVVAMFTLGVSRGTHPAEMFATSIAVAVSAIPEGLTIALTVILAIGMQTILKFKGLVRNLLAAETLGATSVICTDKTGTLTEGNMRVTRIETFARAEETGEEPHKLLNFPDVQELFTAAVVCNDAAAPDESSAAATGNMTDRAIIEAASASGFGIKEARARLLRAAEMPFNSAVKYMWTSHRPEGGKGFVYYKGAPEVILAGVAHVCNEKGKNTHAGAEVLKTLHERLTRLSGQGLRVLCVAKKEGNDMAGPPLQGLTFLGFFGIKDPLRDDAAATIRQTARAGIRTVMITGDHRLTAQAIGRELGLMERGAKVMDGEELKMIPPERLAAEVDTIAVFSRATPEDKLKIIAAWKQKGAVVAMTGDGVNDAPALKAADIGVALGSGTEVAKEASDLVLLDNRFSTIAAAIKEGRVIYDNIRSVVVYLLSNSFSETIAVTVSLVFGWPLPFLPAQILWVNMVTDSFPALALTREPANPAIMEEPPRPRRQPLVDRQHRWIMGMVSVSLAGASLAVFHAYLARYGSVSLARTVSFSLLSVVAILYIFSLRSLKEPLWRISLARNHYIPIAALAGLALQAAVVYLPPLQRLFGTVALRVADWLVILAISCIFIILLEWFKWMHRSMSVKKPAENQKPTK